MDVSWMPKKLKASCKDKGLGDIEVKESIEILSAMMLNQAVRGIV